MIVYLEGLDYIDLDDVVQVHRPVYDGDESKKLVLDDAEELAVRFGSEICYQGTLTTAVVLRGEAAKAVGKALDAHWRVSQQD